MLTYDLWFVLPLYFLPPLTLAACFVPLLWQVPQGAPDKILGIAQAFRNDPSDKKVNLVIGAYRDGNGSPWVLPSVRTAEKRLIERNANKE
jgi:aspartate aminotransferase